MTEQSGSVILNSANLTRKVAWVHYVKFCCANPEKEVQIATVLASCFRGAGQGKRILFPLIFWYFGSNQHLEKVV